MTLSGLSTAGIVKNNASGVLSGEANFLDLSDVTTANVTYYVDDTLGDDGNDGLSAGAGGAFKTIQTAINKIPKWVRNYIVINVADGIYSVAGYVINISFKNIIDEFYSSRIYIVGNTTNPENVILRNTADNSWTRTVYMGHNIGCVYMHGFQLERTGATAQYQEAVLSTGTGQLILRDIKFNYTGGAIKSYAINAVWGSCVTARNCTVNGTAFHYGYNAAYGAFIYICGTQLTATVYKYNSSGGQIFNSDVWYPDYANQHLAIGRVNPETWAKFEIYMASTSETVYIINNNATSNTNAVFRIDANSGLANALKVQRNGNIGLDRSPALAKLDIGGDIRFQKDIQTKTGNHTVLSTESHCVFVGKTNAVNFTLPSAVAGLTYTFIVGTDTVRVTVTAAAGDTIDGSAAAGNTWADAIRETITIVAIDSTSWVITSKLGTWTTT